MILEYRLPALNRKCYSISETTDFYVHFYYIVYRSPAWYSRDFHSSLEIFSSKTDIVY